MDSPLAPEEWGSCGFHSVEGLVSKAIQGLGVVKKHGVEWNGLHPALRHEISQNYMQEKHHVDAPDPCLGWRACHLPPQELLLPFCQISFQPSSTGMAPSKPTTI